MWSQFLLDVGGLGVQCGLHRALLLMAEMAVKNRSREKFFQVKVPHLAHPLWMRPNTSDTRVFYQVFVHREYALDNLPQNVWLMERYKQISASRAPLVLDCGANIGLSAVWFANLFPKARVLAIEPDPGNIEVLRKNAEAYQNVEVIEGAVWDTPTPVSIKNPDAAAWMFRVGETSTGVPARTINQLSAGGDIFIAKIDIEGAEQAVFRSNTEWLQKTDMLTIELHDWMFPGGRTSQSCLQQIVKYDFDFVLRGENLSFIFRR
jgi:FkbM family methyltransferase